MSKPDSDEDFLTEPSDDFGPILGLGILAVLICLVTVVAVIYSLL